MTILFPFQKQKAKELQNPLGRLSPTFNPPPPASCMALVVVTAGGLVLTPPCQPLTVISSLTQGSLVPPATPAWFS